MSEKQPQINIGQKLQEKIGQIDNLTAEMAELIPYLSAAAPSAGNIMTKLVEAKLWTINTLSLVQLISEKKE